MGKIIFAFLLIASVLNGCTKEETEKSMLMDEIFIEEEFIEEYVLHENVLTWDEIGNPNE